MKGNGDEKAFEKGSAPRENGKTKERGK